MKDTSWREENIQDRKAFLLNLERRMIEQNFINLSQRLIKLFANKIPKSANNTNGSDAAKTAGN